MRSDEPDFAGCKPPDGHDMSLTQTLQALQAHWDLVTGRYAVVPVDDGPDRADATALLKATRDDDLHSALVDDPWASAVFGGTTPPTHALGVRDRRSGRMVGALQFTAATPLMAVPDTVAAYALDRVDPALAARTMVVTRFALLPEAHRSPAGLALLAEACRVGITLGFSAAAFVAEPALLSRFLHLGARPLAPMRASPYGGYGIPLLVLMADRAYLEAVNSPLRLLVKPGDFGADDPGLAWRRDFERRYGRIETGVSAYDPQRDDEADPVHAMLSRGMSDAEVGALLAGSLTLSAAVGDHIVARGDSGSLLGVVAAGVLHVVIGGHVVAALGRGEPFGEIAFATGEPRSADLVAASPDTRLLQFSPTALAGLPTHAALCLWRNLAWCLARRVVERTSVGTH